MIDLLLSTVYFLEWTITRSFYTTAQKSINKNPAIMAILAG